MLTTVEGIYKDGQIEFSETPPSLKEGRVLITFLTNGNGTVILPVPKGRMITFGMFPELNDLMEEDF